RKEKRWAFYKWITIIVFSGLAMVGWYWYNILCIFFFFNSPPPLFGEYGRWGARYDNAYAMHIIGNNQLLLPLWFLIVVILGFWIFSFSLEISNWFLNKADWAKRIKMIFLFGLFIIIIYTMSYYTSDIYHRAGYLKSMEEGIMLLPVAIINSIWEMFFDIFYYFTFTINEPA
ncbi:MAG: hypothetical protein QM529_04895, partial [Hydrotalea sp.]|nr:hypothetical protein [Hydrotalea sp.]